jgi:Tol biopolymer transport system component
VVAQIAFSSSRNGHLDLYVKSSSRPGDPEPLLLDGRDKMPTTWSPDGRFIVYNVDNGPPTGRDIWVLPLTGDRKPFPLAQSNFSEGNAQFSPDGRWVAYTSNESESGTVDGRCHEFDAGPARTLFSMRAVFQANSSAYEVTSDGQRFVVNTPVDQSRSTGVVRVIINWAAALKK